MDTAEPQPTEDDWPCKAEAYERGPYPIGQGAFATVWRANCREKNQDAALKIMNLDTVATSLEDIRAEVQTMRMMNHKNALSCKCSFINKKELWLVTQLMDKGSCLHIMQSLRRKGLGEGLKEEWIATILKETLLGLEYFHANGQIHRDVKAGNILVDKEGSVRIADFGVAGLLQQQAGIERAKNRTTFVGTPCWMAPEVMEQAMGYNHKADIWSFGITALELAKGFAPYARFPPMKVLLLTLQEEPPSLKSYDDEKDSAGRPFSNAFKVFVAECLNKDPAKRPTASKLLKNAFFKKAIPLQQLQAELLSSIDDIGLEPLAMSERLPGQQPLYATGVKGPDGEDPKTESKEFVPGTTWIFDFEDSGIPQRSGPETEAMKAKKEEKKKMESAVQQDFGSVFDKLDIGEDG